jgi:high-affinity nickel-transport protein
LRLVVVGEGKSWVPAFAGTTGGVGQRVTPGALMSDGETPGLGRKVTFMMAALAAANITVWAAALAAFQHYPLLLGTCLLAYSFGLRHAVDADHIAAIDNTTRKLMQQGQRPAGVGLYFSLGHSTIVFGLSAAVAITAVTIRNRFAGLEIFGDVAGTLVSALFLFGVAGLNAAILLAMLRGFNRLKAGGADEDLALLLAKRGFFGRLFRGLFRLVNHSWQMYPIGVLFGLGFDTATEIGLLGISAAQASKGLPIWSIMLFPALFAAGMALIDTADSVLMLGAYGWAFASPLRKLRYNITVTAISVIVALIVGGIEILGLLQNQMNLTGPAWTPITSLNNNFGTIGYLIIALFAASLLISFIVSKRGWGGGSK